MFYNDHDPPHFHAVYGEYKAVVEIKTGEVTGNLPSRSRRLVIEWLEIHREELLENWELARARKPLKKVKPLE